MAIGRMLVGIIGGTITEWAAIDATKAIIEKGIEVGILKATEEFKKGLICGAVGVTMYPLGEAISHNVYDKSKELIKKTKENAIKKIEESKKDEQSKSNEEFMEKYEELREEIVGTIEPAK